MSKICLLGNMNNNNYVLLRYLIDLNYDAELLLYEDEQDQFKPINDSYDLQYFSQIKKLAWGSFSSLNNTLKQKIYNDLIKYDFIIGNGLAPAYCEFSGIKLDVFNPYGADLFYYTKYNLTYPSKIYKLWKTVSYQKKGINKVPIWYMKQEYPKYEKVWSRLKNPSSKRWFIPPPYVYEKQYNEIPYYQYKKKSRLNKLIDEQINDVQLSIFLPTRHYFSLNIFDPNNKRTDVLFRGLSIFVKKYPKKKIKLITTKYGKSFGKIDKLINSLGIKNSVLVLPTMPRKDLSIIYEKVDIIAGNFGRHSNFINGITSEALCFAKPIMTHRIDNYYRGFFDNIFDIINVNSPKEVYESIMYYIDKKEELKKIGAKGKDWYLKNVVQKNIDHFKSFFN